jgi:hypothetical protein
VSEALELESVEVGQELELAAPAGTLFRTDDPDEVVARATRTANTLANVIREQKLATNIKGREHVRVEGWSLLGTMLGVFPVCTETRKTEDGWIARVEARTLSGAVVGAAEAICSRSEKTWATREDYALCSMAQTRATSKALRQPLGFVMTLAGFAETPAEEMPRDFQEPPTGAAQTQDQRDELFKIVRHLEELAPSVLREEDWATTLKAFTEAQFGKSESKALSKDEMDSLIVYALDLAKTEIPRSPG